MIDDCCIHSSLVNFEVTGLNLTKFLNNVEKILSFNLLKLKLQSCDQFWNASMLNEGGVGQFLQIWQENWLPWQRPLGNCRMNEASHSTTNPKHFGEDRSSSLWEYIWVIRIWTTKIWKN